MPDKQANDRAVIGQLAEDSLLLGRTAERYWVGPFEDDLTELGFRAALWGVEENEGGNTAELMLQDWEDLGRGRMTDPWEWRRKHGRRLDAA